MLSIFTGDVTMMLGQHSWRMTSGFPEELEFGAYIGWQEKFTLPPSVSSTLIETDWRSWFESILLSLIEQTSIDYEGHVQKVRQLYDPPTFDALSNYELKERCLSLWPNFQRYWLHFDGEKGRATKRLREQMSIIRPDQLIASVVKKRRRKQTHPFSLSVNFVIWPEDYRREIHNNVIVLGLQYLETKNSEALSHILIESILKHV